MFGIINDGFFLKRKTKRPLSSGEAKTGV
jgi:hypothetical protein